MAIMRPIGHRAQARPRSRPEYPGTSALQLSLLDQPTIQSSWPARDRFPGNDRPNTVGSLVQADLLAARSPLLVTGYASLSKIVDFLAACSQRPEPFERVRILLGHEPTPVRNATHRLGSRTLSREIEEYWLERGISVLQSVQVLEAIAFVRGGKVEARISAHEWQPVHAKVFKADAAVTLGSSNFSLAGLEQQVEANARFSPAEPQRFAEAGEMAECIWEGGIDYLAGLTKLLDELLRVVTWQEALARAAGELLEGDWAARYLQTLPWADLPHLWPSQTAGVAQALWILETVGSVLVADATGSGKTRTGVRLLRAALQRIWGSGRIRREFPVLTCPPNVGDTWRRELTACGMPIEPYSHGLLSQVSSDRRDAATAALSHAQVLAIDEAHNFLNPRSRRTLTLFSNVADHVLLFTATPINRGARDLMAIVDLLGADNFDDEVLAVLDTMWKRRTDRAPSEADREALRRAVQRFTVRRTKRQLNEMISLAPERYRDAFGRPCRYPEHRARIYEGGESEEDRRLARAIWTAAQRLRGLVNLRGTLAVSAAQRIDGWTEETYLDWCLRGASALAAHHVLAALRSSRAAVLEHLRGTAWVREREPQLGTVKNKATGNIIETITLAAGQPPENGLGIALPPWLTDTELHAQACREEMAIYEEIGNLVARMSEAREEKKAKELGNLLRSHRLVLAFDSHLISLADIRQRLSRHTDAEIIIATGERAAEQRAVNERFALTSQEVVQKTIALCSDALAEGINLQGADAIVHLDMPTVIRVAEQRVGRVDRMDSPHVAIEVLWPKDSPEFAMRGDERFFARHQLVSDVLGSNLPLPDELRGPGPSPEDVITPEAMLEEMRAAEPVTAGLADAFEPVRALVAGGDAIVAESTYARLRDSKATVISTVSVVSARQAWAFFAIRGTEWGAPRWVFLDGVGGEPLVDLDRVAQELRARLGPEVGDRSLDQLAASLLRCFVERLGETEELLLPKKKQRALAEMRIVLEQYAKAAAAGSGERQRLELVREVLALGKPGSADRTVDRGALAERWLDLVRPAWLNRLLRTRRTRPLMLRDIRKDLIAQPLTTEEMLQAFSDLPLTMPIGERIVAAILGVP